MVLKHLINIRKKVNLRLTMQVYTHTRCVYGLELKISRIRTTIIFHFFLNCRYNSEIRVVLLLALCG